MISLQQQLNDEAKKNAMKTTAKLPDTRWEGVGAKGRGVLTVAAFADTDVALAILTAV